LPISAVDTITLAFQHTKRQLVQPFRFWQWTRLAAVGLLAGEMGSGGCNVPSNFNLPQQTGNSRHLLDTGFGGIDPALYAGLIAVLILAGLVFAVIMMYISSVMRFVLFDSVLTKECHIRQGWSRRQYPGWRYFLWQLGYTAATLAGLVILLGIPAGFAFAMGWLTAPREHVLALVLGGIVVFFLIVIFFVTAAVVHVLTKDFVVPQMALEGIGAMEGWRRLWPMMQGEKGGYAVYVLMKIVLAIGAGIVIGVVSLIMGLIVAIDRGTGDCRGAHGKECWAHVECCHDYRGRGGGMCAAGGFSVFAGIDRGAGDRVLSGVLDLFLCGAVSGVEPGGVSAASRGSDLRGEWRAARTSAVAHDSIARRGWPRCRSADSRRRLSPHVLLCASGSGYFFP